MKHLSPLFLLALAGCAGTSGPKAPEGPVEHVILISIDGLPADTLRNPLVQLPTLRRMAAEGASAEGMRCSFPTVTWPNHTTLVTGVPPAKHGVLANSYLDRSTGKVVPLLPDPLFDKDAIVKAPTIYDLAHQRGLKTAGVIWPATRNAKSLDWTVPDCGTKELWDKYATASWLDELRRDGIWVDQQESWVKGNGGVQRDWMYAKAACQVIRVHHPNLVLLHLVEVDHVEHQKGPRTPDAYWAASYEDDRVREILEAVEAAGLRQKTAIVVVSDHGFFGYTKTVYVDAALKKGGVDQSQAVSQGGAAFIYLRDPSLRAPAKAILERLEGVRTVLEPSEYARWGMSRLEDDPRMGDLVVAAKEGYSFSDKPSEILIEEKPLQGAHGYLPDDPKLLATFVAWGAGIKPGTRLGVIDSIDVAPTVARLLGLAMEKVDGHPREEILR
jgi:predicted AlkP superfamily pyrophosphatase or phosphodiesterase